MPVDGPVKEIAMDDVAHRQIAALRSDLAAKEQECEGYRTALWAARMWRLTRPEGEGGPPRNDAERLLLQVLDDLEWVPDNPLPQRVR